MIHPSTKHYIEKLFNPLILRCSGWKKKKELYAGDYRTLWKNPDTGHWLVESAAIEICERHMLGGKT